MTRTTTRYLPRIGIYYSTLLTMKMTKLIDFNKFLRLKCIFLFWSKADDPPNKPTPKNQVQKLGPEIRLIRRKIRYILNC